MKDHYSPWKTMYASLFRGELRSYIQNYDEFDIAEQELYKLWFYQFLIYTKTKCIKTVFEKFHELKPGGPYNKAIRFHDMIVESIFALLNRMDESE